MSDRIDALTVILDRDIRDDDIEPTLAAIRQIRHVLSVEPIVSDPMRVVAEMRVDAEWRGRIIRLLDEGRSGAEAEDPR